MAVRRGFYSQEPEVYGASNRIGTGSRADLYQVYRDSHTTALGWDAAMTPRKWRTIYATNAFQPTWLYQKQSYRAPNKEWIGKYFIPVDAYPEDPTKSNYVMEYDIMRKAGMYAYRILYAVENTEKNGFNPRPGDPSWVIKSKPSVEGRPGQMNIILSPKNIILDVQFW
jgi:hypothetical protein